MSSTSERRSGFTLLELLVVISIIALLIGILLPTFGAPRRTANGMKRSSQLRGWHQSAVIFAQTNGGYLPGLDPSGQIIADGEATGFSGAGSTPMARFWILLEQKFIPAEMLANPQETLSEKWKTGPVTREHYSYAALRIDSETTDAGRLAEWKDNANAHAALMSDRNIGATANDADVQSLWTEKPGEWKGNVVWGDNHAEFTVSHKPKMTRFGGVQTDDDSIFLDESGSTGSNALMVR